jgi:hypothetical protein
MLKPNPELIPTQNTQVKVKIKQLRKPNNQSAFKFCSQKHLLWFRKALPFQRSRKLCLLINKLKLKKFTRP